MDAAADAGCAGRGPRRARRHHASTARACSTRATRSRSAPRSGCGLCRTPRRRATSLLVVGSELGDSDLWGGRITGTAVIRVDIDAGPAAQELPRRRHAARRRRRGAVGRADGPAARTARGPGTAPPALPRLREACRTEARRDAGPYAAVNAAVRAALPADGVLTGDSSQVTYFGSVHFFDVPAPRRFCYTPGYATLGYGLPAAIGAALAAPGRAGGRAARRRRPDVLRAGARHGRRAGAAAADRGGGQRRLPARSATRSRPAASRPSASTCTRPTSRCSPRAMGGARRRAPSRHRSRSPGCVHDALGRRPPDLDSTSTCDGSEPVDVAIVIVYLVAMIAVRLLGQAPGHHPVRLPRRRPPARPADVLRHHGRGRAGRRVDDRRRRARLRVRHLRHVAGGRDRRRHPGAVAAVRRPDPAPARLHREPDAGAALRARVERALRRGDVGLHADALGHLDDRLRDDLRRAARPGQGPVDPARRRYRGDLLDAGRHVVDHAHRLRPVRDQDDRHLLHPAAGRAGAGRAGSPGWPRSCP